MDIVQITRRKIYQLNKIINVHKSFFLNSYYNIKRYFLSITMKSHVIYLYEVSL